MKRIRDFGNVAQLAKAEQYFAEVICHAAVQGTCANVCTFQIMTIPRLQQRLNCMVFRRKVELDIEEVRPDLDIVRSSSKELRGSERFRNVLKVIYTFRNASPRASTNRRELYAGPSSGSPNTKSSASFMFHIWLSGN